MEKNTEIIKLSASSIKTYEQCPKKYFFNYIERAPRKQWAHFDLGNLCHKALEFFHIDYCENGTKKRSLKKMMGSAFARARKEYPNLSEYNLAEAKNMLQDYLNAIKTNGMPNVLGTEVNFDFEIAPNVIIRGFLDRVDLEDNIYHIIDYKTTKNAQYLDEFQLLIYGIWLLKKYPDIKNFKGSYVLLKHGSSLKSYSFTADDVKETKMKVLSYANTILNEDTWSTIPHRLCNWCDFKDICPAQKAW